MKLEFVFIAESGVLEQQSLLLCESLRSFGGRYAEADVAILEPRRERRISDEGRSRFQAMDARVVECSIASPCPEYGPSYRAFACAEYERSSRADRLVFMDSDTLLIAEPDLDLQDADVAVRPVDVQGMCTFGAADSNDEYWRELCRICQVDYDSIPFVTTTVEGLQVKASYNGGLTVVDRTAGLFQKTAEFFVKSIAVKLFPRPNQATSFPAGHGEVCAEGGRLWGSSQACLSLAVTALGLRVRVLPSSQNFPLHSYPELRLRMGNEIFPAISHVHYHHVFRNDPLDNPILAGKPGFSSDSKSWLWARVGRLA
jgi:hypothetical protein